MSAPDATGGKKFGDGPTAVGGTIPQTVVGAPSATGAPPSVPPPTPAPAPDTAAERGRRGVGYTTYAITILVAVLALLLVLFVVQNNERVEIWLFGSTQQMSVAGALAAAAAVGLLVGLLIGVIPQIKLRRELRGLRRAGRG